jgi:class 3 adenylate cyclase/predicted ATPase
MEFAGWLRKLGLEQYEAIFRENAIDETVLPDLTDQDLEKMGVLLGHRRRLLRAIANLEPEKGISAMPAAATPPAGPVAQETTERRQVSVMFSDLVGSTALSARMDPEDLREVIAAYHKCVAEIVRRLDGFIAQYLGDGVLAYFGYPQAHEDDAERAVRSGLELTAAVGGLKTRASLQTRVGIATGLVVVGDLMDSGSTRERGIVGNAPNLAARLQGIAEPNMVVIAESTQKLLGNLFELADLGTRDLKGVAGPVRAWAALRASPVESRFEALHASGLTDLVGREEELEILFRRWSRAKRGEGQVVLLSGEAGIGKSRLTAALLERLADEPHSRLRYLCSPQHTDSAFYPIINQMERAAGFAHDDTPRAKLDKLDILLARSSTSGEEAALFAELLSLPNDERYPALDLDTQQRRQRTLAALISQLEALADHNPLLMILEDAHWTDPTSLELFGRMVDRLRSLRVLLIVTYRSEFSPPWIGLPHVTALTINRLAAREASAMIDRLVDNIGLPTSIRQDIIERTDGIPLFVEEMTKAMLEAEGENAAKSAPASAPSPAVAVPASLHASLMARLDRLGPAKEVAQVGAAIGREFSYTLLAAVVRTPEAELTSALNRLIVARLLFRQGEPPYATYLFNHALVRDAAYGTLLRERRRALHARIAATLESQFADITERQPELLAHHCTEAELIEKAAGLWGKAGQRSLERSALVEGVAQLTRGLAEIATLPGTPALRREEIKLQVALISPLFHVKGYAAPETKAAAERACQLIARAEALGETPEDPLLLFLISYGFWSGTFVAFNGDICLDLAAEFLALAEKQGAVVPLVIGHRMMGPCLMMRGEIAKGRAHLDKAMALYDPAKHRHQATRFGHDASVTILCTRSSNLWLLGYPAAALRDADQALGTAREIGQASSLMLALHLAGRVQILCGNYSVATAFAEETRAMGDEKGSLFFKGIGMLNQGWVLASTGKSSDAVQLITSGLFAYRSTASTTTIPGYLANLAMAYANLGQFDDARRSIGEAMTMMETTKEKWFEADIHRMAGEIALMLRDPDIATAEACFERALDIAREQQAKSLELRAATSMARLRRSQGKVEQARDLLSLVYGWFTEGFDTLDLKQARALLDELVS